jgi:prevent-host-death family protein
MKLNLAEDILPVTDFRKSVADVLARLSQTGRPLVLTQRGRASAVLLDVGTYQTICNRLENTEQEPSQTTSPVETDAPKATATDEIDLVRELEECIQDDTI